MKFQFPYLIAGERIVLFGTAPPIWHSVSYLESRPKGNQFNTA